MTAWHDEAAAITNMIENFGSGVFACVMDSYDYAAALEEVLPAVASKKVGAGGPKGPGGLDCRCTVLPGPSHPQPGPPYAPSPRPCPCHRTPRSPRAATWCCGPTAATP
jgi:hypothetical protein